MGNEAKIYGYRLTLESPNLYIDEFEFTVIEKANSFILKEGVTNFRKRMVYSLNASIEEEPVLEEQREKFFFDRKTFKKSELNTLYLYNFGKNFIVYYEEPSLEQAMMLFKEKLGRIISRFQRELKNLEVKIQTCKGFVEDELKQMDNEGDKK